MLLACIYIAGSIRVCIPILTYAINYEYVSTVLCENKAKPEMHCNGKCHLKKELKKATEQDNKEKKSIPSSSDDNVIENTPATVIYNYPPYEFLSYNRLGIMYSNLYTLIHQDTNTPPPKA